MGRIGETKQRRPRLTRDEIVENALAVIDSEGLDALSMRGLGKRLGVDPMALYYHVKNKSALIDAVIDSVMADVDVSVDDPEASWPERLRRIAVAYRDALKAHPNLLPAIASGHARMFGGPRPAETLLSILSAAGLPRDRWMIAMSIFSSWVLGSTIMEMTAGEDSSKVIIDWAVNLPSGSHPHITKAIAAHSPGAPDTLFHYGTLTLIAGLSNLARADVHNGSAIASRT